MEAYIQAISYYLPEKVISNVELSRIFPEWSADKISSKIGILERHIAADNELSSDMAIKAGFRLFEEHNIDKAKIDFVILCTQSPDYFLPTTSCIIQSKLGLKKEIGALDFNLGCSGYVYGLAIAKGLVVSKIANNVLLLTSETYSKFIHSEDKSNRTIFGDAASATLISSEGYASISEFDLGTDGLGANNLIVKTGGLRQKSSTDISTVDEYGNIISDNHLFMNGGEIFSFTLEAVPVLVDNVLKKNNLSIGEIDLFVFHQANKYILNHLRKKLTIPEEKFYYYIEKVGNTVSSTIPIALYEAIKEKKAIDNSKVLLAGFGVGYSWGGVILRF